MDNGSQITRSLRPLRCCGGSYELSRSEIAYLTRDSIHNESADTE